MPAGVGRIGIDELSYKKDHTYFLIVVNSDADRLVWAASDRTTATVRGSST